MRRLELFRLMVNGAVWMALVAVVTIMAIDLARGQAPNPNAMALGVTSASLFGIALGAVVYRIRQ